MAAIIMEIAKLRKYMTIDNFDLIEENLKFESNDDFYFLQVIQRKKDGNVTGRGNNGARLIKAYYIHSVDYLEEKKQKIIELCQNNNARAYIHFNKRSYFKTACGAQEKLARMLMEGNTFQAPRVWDHVCGELPAQSGRNLLRLVDVDTCDKWKLNAIIRIVNSCRGNEDNKVKLVVPTLHGYHLITSKFDVEQCQQELAINGIDALDIHRDNPTLLYYHEPRIVGG